MVKNKGKISKEEYELKIISLELIDGIMRANKKDEKEIIEAFESKRLIPEDIDRGMIYFDKSKYDVSRIILEQKSKLFPISIETTITDSEINWNILRGIDINNIQNKKYKVEFKEIKRVYYRLIEEQAQKLDYNSYSKGYKQTIFERINFDKSYPEELSFVYIGNLFEDLVIEMYRRCGKE